MKRIVLQIDKPDLVSVDGFIRNICDENHINNYYATLSVPVMRAVEKGVAFGLEQQKGSEITVLCDYCASGIVFRVDGLPGFLNNDDLMVANMLADKVELSNDASSVQMTFAIRGISSEEAARRVATLECFYHSPSAVVMQM